MNPKQVVKLLRIKGNTEQSNKIAKAIVKYEKSLLTKNQLNDYCRSIWDMYETKNVNPK